MVKKKKTNKIKANRNDRHYEQFYHSLLLQHPELKRANKQEELDAINAYFTERDLSNKKKMKHRLEFLTDGIIAIIITIMVLEIPLPVEASVSYEMFLSSTGIFFLSFFLVAVFWYEHFKLFAESEFISSKVAAINLVFLAVLALIPVLTKWMMMDVSRLSVVNYGVAYLIINFVKSLMFWIVRREHVNDVAWSGPQMKFIYAQFIFSLIMNFVLLYIAWQKPSVGLILYISLPLSSFFSQLFVSRRDLRDISNKKHLFRK